MFFDHPRVLFAVFAELSIYIFGWGRNLSWRPNFGGNDTIVWPFRPTYGVKNIAYRDWMWMVGPDRLELSTCRL